MPAASLDCEEDQGEGRTDLDRLGLRAWVGGLALDRGREAPF